MKKLFLSWLWLGLFILWLFFVLGTFFWVQKPFEPNNAKAIANVFLDLLTVTWLAVLGLLAGSWLLRRALALDLSLLETLIFGPALGLGLLGLLAFGLGLLGLFTPLIFYSLTIFLTLLVTPQIKPLLYLWQTRPPFPIPNLPSTVYLLLITLFTLPLALLPPTDVDGLFYHLTGPKLYIQAGGIIGGIDIPHLSFPAHMEMLFTWAMLLRGDIAAKLLHLLFAFLLAGLIYLIATQFFNKKSAWLAVLIFASMPMINTLASWAYNDIALAFYQLAGLYALIRWTLDAGKPDSKHQTVSSEQLDEIQNPKPKIQNRSWLILSGIFVGLAMGMKYTSVVTPVTIGLLILWYSAKPFRPLSSVLQRAVLNAAIFSVVAFLIASPWYAKNFAFTGNPVYPFLSDLFGGHYWDAFRADWYAAANTGIGFRASTLLSLPWLLTVGVRDVNYWDGRTGPLLLLFLPLVLFYALFYHRNRFAVIGAVSETQEEPIRRPSALNPLLFYALAQFLFWTVGVIWSRSLWQSRLLLPSLVALAPVIGWLWADLTQFDRPNFSLSGFANLAIALTLALTLVDVGLLARKINPLPYLIGFETRQEYLTRRLGAHYAAMEEINASLPAGARIVFLWEPRSYYCRRDCRPDSILDTFPHLVYQHQTPERIAKMWHQNGITHILLHRSGLNFVLDEAPEAIDLAVLNEIEANHLNLAQDIGGAYQLYSLEPAP